MTATVFIFFTELQARVSLSLVHQKLKKLLVHVNSLMKCSGIGDQNLQDVKCSSAFRFVTTKVTADATLVTTSIMRSKVCMGCTESSGTQCGQCKQLHKSLVEKINISKVSRIHPKTPLHLLSKENLIQELKSTRVDMKRLEKLKNELATKSMNVSSDVSDGLASVMSGCLPKDNRNELMQLFWEEQKKAFGRDPRGMRWHPTLLRFAIYIHYQSPRAYEALKSTGVLRLPNKSTLRDYTNVISPTTGFQLQALEVNFFGY